LGMKKTFTRGIFVELLWFLKGDTNIKYLVDNNVHIWNEWAYKTFLTHAEALDEPDYEFHKEDVQNNCTRPLTQSEFVSEIKRRAHNDSWVQKWGALGPVYGKQWIEWTGVRNGVINQIDNLIESLTKNPDSRRHIVNAWNVDDLPEMALTPCHCLFQFNVVDVSYEENERAIQLGYDPENIPTKKLDCQLYQRSADVFLGVPFNIASYALLLEMIAQVTGMLPGEFIHTFGDAHLYVNHREQVNSYLNRTHLTQESVDTMLESKDFKEPILGDDYYVSRQDASTRTGKYEGPTLPTLELNKNIKSIYDFTLDDIKVKNYNPLPAIKAPIAV
jgi:thymidylate synthase